MPIDQTLHDAAALLSWQIYKRPRPHREIVICDLHNIRTIARLKSIDAVRKLLSAHLHEMCPRILPWERDDVKRFLRDRDLQLSYLPHMWYFKRTEEQTYQSVPRLIDVLTLTDNMAEYLMTRGQSIGRSLEEDFFERNPHA